jgi:hypothetical protein
MINGALMAALAMRGGGGAAVLARLGGAVGAAARQRGEELAAMPAEVRERAVARELARAASPVPAGMRALHAEWSEALLAAEPEARWLLEDVASGAAPAVTRTMSPERVWILRRAFGAVPQRSPEADEVAAALAELRRRGAAALAAVLGGQRAAVAAALAQLGAASAASEALRAAVREREQAASGPGSGAGEGATSGAGGRALIVDGKAAARACRGVELRSAHALERIGVAAMGEELAAASLRWLALCCYVPKALGMLIAARLS